MGDRGQIKMVNSGVYLYTHWEGSELKEKLQAALKKGQRWNDEEYLTRIIFCEMIKGLEQEPDGYGIGTIEHTDLNNDIIEVDVDRQEISIGNKCYGFESFCDEKF